MLDDESLVVSAMQDVERAWLNARVSSHRAVGPRVLLSVSWSTLLVLPTQPDPDEHRYNHRYVVKL